MRLESAFQLASGIRDRINHVAAVEKVICPPFVYLATVEVAGRLVEAAGAGPSGMEVLVCLRPEDVVLSPAEEPPPHTSARNRLPAVVRRIVPSGPYARVELDAGFPLVSLITKQSQEELALDRGAAVVASFKAMAVHLIPHRP